jgi:16S rRNA G966 N2-methylase RsmD
VSSTRNGAIFNAHSYPTKINVEAAMVCIARNTKPGDVVLDCFSGSGTTGLAASLLGSDDRELRQRVESIVGPGKWGARDAVLYDISVLGTAIADALLNPPPVEEFLDHASRILDSLQANFGWMYETVDLEGRNSTIRHTIWSEVGRCSRCRSSFTLWDVAAELEPPALRRIGKCPECKEEFALRNVERVTETYFDDVLSERRERRVRVPALVYGSSGNQNWRRVASDSDRRSLVEIEKAPLPPVPVRPLTTRADGRWGELYRSGYHFGITHVHDFYSRRSLAVVAAAFDSIRHAPTHLQDGIRLWLSSYNSSHSTLMTRIVCKKDANDFVVTGSQPGALYISSFPVEKNVIRGLKRKLTTISDAFREIRGRTNRVSVRRASSTRLDLPDASVDYVFTDPPFGDNIQYAEGNIVSEAWLGELTDQVEEAVVSRYQGKNTDRYEQLLTQSFAEAFRVLKPNGWMSVVFHSTRAEHWNGLTRALEESGLTIESASHLRKTQL